MTRPLRWLPSLLVAVALGLFGARAGQADDPAPPEPKAKAPIPAPEAAVARAESRVVVSLMKATGRILLKYLDEKQDPEKAAAYEDVFRALGGMLAQVDRDDERKMAAAGMKAMVDLMPTMNTPKRSEVMREILATFAAAVAEAMKSDAAPATAGDHPETTAVKPQPVGDVLLGALADCLLEEATARMLGGAELDAPVAGVEGFRVKAVQAGSKAAALGLAPGDRIVRFGDTTASWLALLTAAETLHRRGELPSMTVVRAGGTVELKPAPAAPRPAEAPHEPAPR